MLDVLPLPLLPVTITVKIFSMADWCIEICGFAFTGGKSSVLFDYVEETKYETTRKVFSRTLTGVTTC